MDTVSLTLTIDGNEYDVVRGQSLLSALINNEIFETRRNFITGEGRFGICGMGTCFECEVHIGQIGIRRACMVAIESDLIIETFDKHGD